MVSRAAELDNVAGSAWPPELRADGARISTHSCAAAHARREKKRRRGAGERARTSAESSDLSVTMSSLLQHFSTLAMEPRLMPRDMLRSHR